jgi:hypothetical protein
MSAKQDRTYTRTASDLERKLGLKERFSQVMGIAEDAQRKAEEASENFGDLDQEAVFNLLTNNGQLQGIYRGDDGEIYINASYLASGIISSADGKVQINLQGGSMPIFNTGVSTNGLKVRGDSVGAKDVFTIDAIPVSANGTTVDTFRFIVQDTDGNVVGAMNEQFEIKDGNIQSTGIQFRLSNDAKTRLIDMKTTSNTAYIALTTSDTGDPVGRFGVFKDGTSELLCDKVTGLSAPSNGTDAANKAYVDSHNAEYKVYNDTSSTSVSVALPNDAGRYLGVLTEMGGNGHDSTNLPVMFILETGYDPSNFRVTNVIGSGMTVTYSGGRYYFTRAGYGFQKLWLKSLG